MTTVKKSGRPPLHDQSMVRVTIWLTQQQVEEAKRLGHGEVGKGLRELIDSHLNK